SRVLSRMRRVGNVPGTEQMGSRARPSFPECRRTYFLESGDRLRTDRFARLAERNAARAPGDDTDRLPGRGLSRRVFQRHDILAATVCDCGDDAGGGHGIQLSCAVRIDAVAVYRRATTYRLVLAAGQPARRAGH